MKRLCLLIIMLCCFFAPSWQADAAGNGTWRTIEPLDMKQQADHSAPLVESLPSNSPVVASSTTYVNGEKWLLITSSTGQQGWVLANALGVKGTINATNVSFRTQPTTSSTKKKALSKGTTVTIIDIASNQWMKVRLNDDIGYVYGEYVTYVADDWKFLRAQPRSATVLKDTMTKEGSTVLKGTIVTVYSETTSAVETASGTLERNDVFFSRQEQALYTINDGTKILREANGMSDAISYVARGTKLTALELYNGYYHVALANDTYGWIAANSVTTSNDSFVKQAVQTQTAKLYRTASDSEPIGTLPFNTLLTVLTTTKVGTTIWTYVETPAGYFGWTPQYEMMPSDYGRTKTATTMTLSDESTLTLNSNETLVILEKRDSFAFVETTTKQRGLVALSDIAPVVATGKRALFTPIVTKSGANVTISWRKISSNRVTYTRPNRTTIQLSGDFAKFDANGAITSYATKLANGNYRVIFALKGNETFTIRENSQRFSITLMPKGLKGKRIIVDAGHGGKDSGARGPSGLLEKTVTLKAALLLKKELEKYGAIVTLTRSRDVFLELSERTAIANNSSADLFISLHADAFSKSSRGSTTYYNSTTNYNALQSKRVAQYVQTSLISQTKTYNRGTKTEQFYVNRKNELPSILVELAFISNPTEEKLLRSTTFLQKASVGIRQGVQQFFME